MFSRLIYSCLIVICILMGELHCQLEFEPGSSNQQNIVLKAASPVRYLLYEVNPGEGFNLRRDVYLRMANLVKFANDADSNKQWILVLPPWGRLYHWKSSIEQIDIPWSRFFDLESLRRHIPVIELSEWKKVVGTPLIDEMYYLQNYQEGWVDGKWTERYDIRRCNEPTRYYKDHETNLYKGYFWGHSDISAVKFNCLSVQAEIKTFIKFLNELTKGQSVMIHRAESLIHGTYSEWSKEYWLARRSVRFSKELKDIANKFRSEFLDSNDTSDLTVEDLDWTKQKKSPGEAKGGPYLAVHLRRRDFLYGGNKRVPSLDSASQQIAALLDKLKLKKVFISTDAPDEELEELKGLLPQFELYNFRPDSSLLSPIGDGGVAIVDQWICVHSRYFTGTSTSTFSFRIHEERSLLGFAHNTTYNRVCGENEDKEECSKSQPSRWMPKY